MEDSEIRCPKCGSTQITANKKGFSGKKAVAGAVLTGGIGVLAGTLGSNKIKITCLACGHTFKPGEDKASMEKKKAQDAKTMRNPFFWVFFVGIIALCWWCTRGCFNSGTSDSNTKTDSTSIQKSNTDISNIEYEIILSDVSSTPIRLDVYVKDTASISKLNDYFIATYNKDGKNYVNFNYFDSKKYAKNYFEVQTSDNYSEQKKDVYFKHYIATYKCNPSTNFKRLDYLHK